MANTTTANAKGDKAIKAARLAISAESIGNESEAQAAALRAGALAKLAGLSLDEFYAALTGDRIAGADLAWCYIVDGYYEA